MLTVISWFAARKSRRQLHEWVARALTDKPTLLAVVSDKYTQEAHVRPFAPIAERFGDRLHVILAAEWEQEDREREGDALFRQLGLEPLARHRALHDVGSARVGVVLRRKQPVALIELFFEEASGGDPREDRIVRQLEDLLVRLQAPVPPPRVEKNEKNDPPPKRDRFELIEIE